MKDLIEKYSPNYDKIVNFLYEDDDFVSSRLITIYRDYLFGNNNRYKKKLDMVLGSYTDKSEFYRYVEDYFRKDDNLLDTDEKILNKLIHLYDEFEKEKLRKINNTRWL